MFDVMKDLDCKLALSELGQLHFPPKSRPPAFKSQSLSGQLHAHNCPRQSGWQPVDSSRSL